MYALSLWAVGQALQWRAGSALVKGGIQLLFAGIVITEVGRKLVTGAEPLTSVMAIAAAVALVANLTCLALLTRFRSHDINMRSVWLCSRNDVIGNAGVLLTTALMAWSGWTWLDLAFGALLTLLFARTGIEALRSAWPQFRARPSHVL